MTKWKRLKSIFTSKMTTDNKVFASDFEQQIQQSIFLLSNAENFDTDKDAIKLLVDNGVEHMEAIEIILFLPIAFVRCLLRTVNWLDIYLEIDKEQSIERKYSETNSFNLIYKVTKNYFNNNPNENIVMKIAGRSAEFNAINKLLLDNPNVKVEEITLSKTVLLR